MKVALYGCRTGMLAIVMGIAAAISTSAAGVAWADSPDTRGSAISSESQTDTDAPSRDARPHRGAEQRTGRRAAPKNERPAADTPTPDPDAIAIERADHNPVPAPAATIPMRSSVLDAEPSTAPPPTAAVVVDVRPAPVAVAAPALPALREVPATPKPLLARPATRPVSVGVLETLFGSTPDNTAESPFSWAALAVARRQNTPARTRPVVPAATATLVNNPPVISNIVLGTPNSTTGAVTGTVTASDPDADKITYKATTSTKGTVSVTTAGVFTYTPTATARHAAAKIGATTAVTTDTVTVTVADARGAATSRAVSVPILPKNSAPTATKTVGSPNAGTGVVTGTVTGADPDKDPLTYKASAPAKGTVSITTAGVFTYTPTATARHAAARIGATTAEKSDNFTVTVADGYGGSLAVPITVAVSPANVAPTATTAIAKPDPVTGVAKGAVTAVDSDKDALRYTASKPANGTVSINADGSFAYTPTATARASARTATSTMTDTFTVTVTDGYGGSKAVSVAATIAPSDSAPVAGNPSATVDAGTGVVTGNVNAVDPDKDPLTYTAATTTTTKGSATVTAAGAYTYTPTAAARDAAGRTTAVAADKMDTFSVTVTDKYGAAAVVPVTVVISPTAAPPTGLSTYCGCTLMPADTVFHADVSALPVLPKSATWTTLVGGNLFAAWGEKWMGHTGGIPVNTVSATRPGETVIFNRGYSTSGPSIDSSPYAIPDYPLVEGMPDSPAWDRHLVVFQEGTCVSQELYNVANGVELPASDFGDALANSIYANNYGSAWIAEAGVHYNMNSPLYPAIGWANASRLPYMPLMLRPDELAGGSIDHMLGIAIAKDRGTGYTWPARFGDGTGTNPDGVPMGTVFRLRADFDISKYDPSTQVVLRALQKHGAVVFDSTSAGQNGATLLAMSNGWTGTGYQTAKQELRTIPMSAFEAVDVLSLAADPATGWAIRSTAV